jgi:hypothetical protein
MPKLGAVLHVMSILDVSQDLAEELLEAHDGVATAAIEAALDGYHG